MKNINLSNLLRILYFVAAICIVAIHCNTISAALEPSRWNVILHRCICHYATFWAVPFFFACSGYFFSQGKYMRCCDGYGFRLFIKSKIKSIALPYIIWSVISAMVLLPVIIACNLFKQHYLLEGTFLETTGFWVQVSSLLGIGVFDGPYHNGPLWFFRFLFLLFVFAPIWRLLASSWIGLIILAGLAYLVHFGFIPSFIYGYSWEFFFLGIILERLSSKFSCKSSDNHGKRSLPRFVRYSFWLYCTHCIVLGYILRLGHLVFGKTNIAIAALTCLAIPLTVILSVLLGMIINRSFPKFFSILNGCRNIE